MFYNYQLSNFKAFGDSANIPVRPLTLIYGANSSGKSSIIQSLLALEQTLKQVEDINIPLLPQGDFVNLGNYREFIHRHETERLFSFKAFFQQGIYDLPDLVIEAANDKMTQPVRVGLEATFNYSSESSKICIDSVKTFLGDESEPFIEYSYDEKDNLFAIESLNPLHFFWKKYLAAKKAETNKSVTKLVRSLFKELEIAGKFPSSRIKQLEKLQVLVDGWEQDIEENDEKSQGNNDKNETKAIEDKIDRVESLIKIVKLFQEYDIEKIYNAYVEISLRFNSKNFLVLELYRNSNEEAEAHPYSDYLAQIFNEIKLDKILSDFNFFLSTTFLGFIKNIVYIGPIRSLPERYYISKNGSERTVGRTGNMTTHVLAKKAELLESVNQKLEDFYINYQLQHISFNASSENEVTSDVYTMHLLDENNISVSLLDVGFGISQVLPVITQSLLSQEQTILIEQPELHLHPKLQTELGDLFIESALGERKNTFIIETHSEHLMLRIMRRMRETYHNELPDGMLSVKPEDVSVLYVEPYRGQSIVREMELNSRGEFVKSWPGGFFEEELDELF